MPEPAPPKSLKQRCAKPGGEDARNPWPPNDLRIHRTPPVASAGRLAESAAWHSWIKVCPPRQQCLDARSMLCRRNPAEHRVAGQPSILRFGPAPVLPETGRHTAQLHHQKPRGHRRRNDANFRRIFLPMHIREALGHPSDREGICCVGRKLLRRPRRRPGSVSRSPADRRVACLYLSQMPGRR